MGFLMKRSCKRTAGTEGRLSKTCDFPELEDLAFPDWCHFMPVETEDLMGVSGLNAHPAETALVTRSIYSSGIGSSVRDRS